ncbi:hypothetical protein P9D51_10830 [Bacillus sonorensis]|uniref:hypothetical protein n=1 Tax=Bacillus sonorensis TaxID=119858 RepID=UPI002DBC1C12|nr:hypothetical protein [Bacillus sonorensis]MEC1426600.1 hypothetical protein [Bacillus sonorensis]
MYFDKEEFLIGALCALGGAICIGLLFYFWSDIFHFIIGVGSFFLQNFLMQDNLTKAIGMALFAFFCFLFFAYLAAKS